MKEGVQGYSRSRYGLVEALYSAIELSLNVLAA